MMQVAIRARTAPITVVTLALAILAANGFAQETASTKEDAAIFAAVRSLTSSMAKEDAAAIEKMLSEDFVRIDPSGTIRSKASFVDLFRKGGLAPQQSEQEHIRIYGDTAVVTMLHINQAPGGATRNLLVSQVWIKRSGRWLLASYQATMAPVRD